jgi:RNA polymerase sigma-70 factor, ECF subfamily
MGSGFSDLLRRAKAGDADALTEIHRSYGRLLTGAVRRRLGPALRRRYDADDIVQSVFADVIDALPSFEDRGEQAFRHWLYRRAERKVASKVRRARDGAGERRERTLGDDAAPAADGPGPATQAGDADESAHLRAALGELPPAQREVLLLRQEAGLRFEAIAERIGAGSVDAARMRYARALIALRARLRPE